MGYLDRGKRHTAPLTTVPALFLGRGGLPALCRPSHPAVTLSSARQRFGSRLKSSFKLFFDFYRVLVKKTKTVADYSNLYRLHHFSNSAN